MSPTIITFSLVSISMAFSLEPTSTTTSNFTPNPNKTLETISDHLIIITPNTTLLSSNNTFEFGFFHTNNQFKWYLGIWYTSIPNPSFVWFENRNNPVQNISSATAVLTTDGRFGVKDYVALIWQTNNTEKAVGIKLLENGNLVLLNNRRLIVWQSFDYPTDTWLPGMNLTKKQWFTSWKSSHDPSLGNYSLRLSPFQSGELELVFNGSYSYWSTGKWTGNAFTGVPEMTVPYIYNFYFANPFKETESFGYTERSLDIGSDPPLTRFQLDYTGQLRQFTWSPQTQNWNMFWSQPENLCSVYGLCGNLGFCSSEMVNPCKCLVGFRPLNVESWDSGDFTGGCRRESDDFCGENDGFEPIGPVIYDGGGSGGGDRGVGAFPGSRSLCESRCLSNCSCIGLYHNARTNLCKNLFGSLLNLRNVTFDSTFEDVMYIRVAKSVTKRRNTKNIVVLIGVISGLVVMLTVVIVSLLVLRKRRVKGERSEEEEDVFPVTNLKVFSYKDLHVATRGFSDKLGHGGFGTVFGGDLLDSSHVAVKRLERPGGAEKEFRAEVCTIGNVQHVNLVRLRGFCSENSHRLLVYDYMPNGPLSLYLKKDGPNLSWDVRFRVAIGTARGIAYLHEECRNCIIHCDIKPENILLDEDFSAKVSDFGLAKLIGRDFSRVLVTMRGTWGYVAPEWISGMAITTKADVYSYGMTLLELIGGRRNVEGPPSGGGGDGGVGTEDKWFFPPWAAQHLIEGDAAAVVDERLCDTYDRVEAERLGLVAVWCIQDEEEMRPTMGMVVKWLEGVVEVTVPPPPKLLQALVSGESFHGFGADSGNEVINSGGGAGCSKGNVEASRSSKASQTSL